MQLSVIIVNYNVRYFLEQCLYSVRKAMAGIAGEVVVVDNASTDGSVGLLQPLFPEVQFIASRKNLGFGRANNLALQQASGRYVLFLNPDTIVPEDCFTRCIDFMERHERAGALGIRMLDGSGSFLPESKRSFPDTTTAFYKLTGLSGLFPRSPVFNRYSLGHLNEGENHAVDVLAGAFMMCRRIVLDQVGGFDEAFFMYGEDIDLSYRLKQAGYENWYFAESRIIHFKGESARKGSLNHTKMFYQAMIIFVNKHYRGRGAGVLRTLLNAGIVFRAVIGGIGGAAIKARTSVLAGGSTRRCCIVGNENEVRECEALLGMTCVVASVSFQSEEQLMQAIESAQANEVIFCSGTLTYSKMIGLIEQLGDRYAYRFHASGSKSIVGSDSKNLEGQVMAGGSNASG